MSGSSGDSAIEDNPPKTHAYDELIAPEAGLNNDDNALKASSETLASIEWDPSYDKCSTLKDVSDILDLLRDQKPGP